MKILTLLVALYFAFALTAAEPSKPAVFEMRLVLDSATADSEQLICPVRTTSGKIVEQKLHVQKKPLLDRTALKSAAPQKNPTTGAPEIHIRLTESGAKRFAAITRDNVGQCLAIVIEGKVYSAPRVMTEIPGGEAVISGIFSEQEAAQLAVRLMEGASGGRKLDQSEPVFAPGVVNFVNTRVADVLDIYRGLSGKELVLDPIVERARGTITLKTDRPMTGTEVTRLLERSLKEQAGVLIAPLDERRVSVTYDSALAPAGAKQGQSGAVPIPPPR